MNNIVKFNDKEVDLIWHNGQWNMASDQIGHALEYSDTRKIAHLYNAHKDEFTEDMTCIVRKGNTRIRIFNREGAWLIGMFARTPKAAEFRKWVLKVLGAVADNLLPSDKPVLVAEHTRALPSPKKEIVLSEKAKQEIGGIVKAVMQAELTKRETMKDMMREVIREEVADYNLKGGIKETPAFNNAPTANGLPIANWLVGISHAVGSINSIYDQMRQRQVDAVKMLSNQ